MKKESQTESVTTRVPTKLKKEFFEYLEKEERVFSKWLRNQMRKALNDASNKKKALNRKKDKY